MKDFDAIVLILFRETSLKNMEQLAKAMGLNHQTLRSRKTKNSIPYKELFFFCRDNNIDIMDLIMKDVREKRPVEKDLEKIALKNEVAYLKNFINEKDEKMKKTLKKALRKARFDIEFIMNSIKPVKKEIPLKYLKRGEIK